MKNRKMGGKSGILPEMVKAASFQESFYGSFAGPGAASVEREQGAAGLFGCGPDPNSQEGRLDKL